MRKIFPKLKKLKPILCLLICAAVLIAFPCMALKRENVVASDDEGVINVWQIDGFEGGKGSRADFLQNIGKEFAKNSACYVTVVSLTADAARLNLKNGNFPDVISYGAGMYGIESYISGYKTWCRGSYCYLTLEGDFSDISSENTVINEGKDNLSGAAALLCGMPDAATDKSTGAYVKLINGKCKYLLGTQRDIYRLKTRGVSFKIKPVSEFNDLYQNISVLTNSGRKKYSEQFIDYLLTRTDEVTKLGLLSDSAHYDDEMRGMEGITYGCRLTAPVSEETHNLLKKYISERDINMLKTSLK